jgi:hypothetical protein
MARKKKTAAETGPPVDPAAPSTLITPGPAAMRRLGKNSPKLDARTLKLARYLKPELPTPPDSTDYTNLETDWGMMQNDRLGCCTIAAVAHAIQTWTLVINQRITVPDSVVVDYYSKWDGYVAGDASTDNGGVELDVLNRWRKSPDGFNGHPLLAYADPDPGDVLHVKQAISLFGGIYIGIALPITAQAQMDRGDPWDVVSHGGFDTQPNSWGGHAVWCPKYDATGITCITWGKLQRMTWDFWAAYCDESHALLSSDFVVPGTGLAPSGFDVATLQDDLQSVTG